MSRAEQLRATRSAAEDAESRRSTTTDDRHECPFLVCLVRIINALISVCLHPQCFCPETATSGCAESQKFSTALETKINLQYEKQSLFLTDATLHLLKVWTSDPLLSLGESLLCKPQVPFVFFFLKFRVREAQSLNPLLNFFFLFFRWPSADSSHQNKLSLVHSCRPGIRSA